jgi:hypothetical protein
MDAASRVCQQFATANMSSSRFPTPGEGPDWRTDYCVASRVETWDRHGLEKLIAFVRLEPAWCFIH